MDSEPDELIEWIRREADRCFDSARFAASGEEWPIVRAPLQRPELAPTKSIWWLRQSSGERVAVRFAAGEYKRESIKGLRAAAILAMLAFLAQLVLGWWFAALLLAWPAVVLGLNSAGKTVHRPSTEIMAERTRLRADLHQHPTFGTAGATLPGVFGERGVVGQRGERATAAILDSLAGRFGNVAVFHGVTPGNHGAADLDHVLLAANMVFIVDSKLWTPGRYTVSGSTLQRDGVNLRPLGDGFRHRAQEFCRAMPSTTQLAPSALWSVTVVHGPTPEARIDVSGMPNESGHEFMTGEQFIPWIAAKISSFLHPSSSIDPEKAQFVQRFVNPVG